MYVLHDLFEQIHKLLTLHMVLFLGNQGSGNLSDFPKDILGKQGFKSSFLWLQNSCVSPCITLPLTITRVTLILSMNEVSGL